MCGGIYLSWSRNGAPSCCSPLSISVLTGLLWQRAVSEGERYVLHPRSKPARIPEDVPATEVEGTFRVNGSNKRMRELQAAFETPPRVRSRLLSALLSMQAVLTPLTCVPCSTGRTLTGKRSSSRHTTLPVFSDDTSHRCQYVTSFTVSLLIIEHRAGTCYTP